MITTLVKKELREHWVILGAGLFASLALSAAFLRLPTVDAFNYPPRLWERNSMPVPIVNAGYQEYFSVICYTVAVLLGLLMTWKETIRKTWPFLLHRPVTRLRVLISKLLAGALILLAAAGMPFALLALWSSIPGNFPAPWCIDYLLPGTVTLICAYALFLAAFVTGMWPRGYVIRFTPLIGMGLLILATEELQSRLSVVLISVVAVVLGLGAVLAIFLSIRGMRWSLVLLTGTGVGVALVMAVVIGIGIYDSARSPYASRSGGVYYYPGFTREGDPVVIAQGNYGQYQTVTGLDGAVIAERVQWYNKGLAMASLMNMRKYVQHSWRRGRDRFGIELLHNAYMQHSAFQYLYLNSRDGILIVYDDSSREPVAYIGVNGFMETPEEAEPFADPGVLQGHMMPSHLVRIAARDGLYVIDETRRTVERMHQGESVKLGAAYLTEQNSRQKMLNYVQTADQLVVHDSNEKGTPLFGFRLPAQFLDADHFRAGVVDEKTLALVKTVQKGSGKAHIYCKVDQTGKVLLEEEVVPPENQLVLSPNDESLFSYGSLIPGVNPISIAAGFVLIGNEPSADLSHAYIQIKPFLWFAITVTLIKAFACALITFLILGRWSINRNARIGGSIFAFLGGIPGMMAVYVLMPVEKRIPCPACGVRRLPSGPTCPGCAAAWPKQESRDTDLFATT